MCIWGAQLVEQSELIVCDVICADEQFCDREIWKRKFSALELLFCNSWFYEVSELFEIMMLRSNFLW